MQEFVRFLHRLATATKDCAVVMCRLGTKEALSKALDKHSSNLLLGPELRDLVTDCEKYASLYQKLTTSILAGCIQVSRGTCSVWGVRPDPAQVSRGSAMGEASPHRLGQSAWRVGGTSAACRGADPGRDHPGVPGAGWGLAVPEGRGGRRAGCLSVGRGWWSLQRLAWWEGGRDFPPGAAWTAESP